ncbi:MAG: 3-hydroxyisobutyrate dehydrogenase [Pseudomonadota bacterium]
MTKIAFIGLGNMGGGMCANLVSAGHQVTAFDLDAAAVAKAAEAGAKGASSLAEAVSDAEIVVSMLPAGRHVLSVYFDEGGVCELAAQDCVFIDCSTISVDDARTAIARAAEKGFLMVDAPVSGGVAAASAGTLTFMVGGEADAFDRAKPILEGMGKNIVHAGVAGNGQAAKTANNMLLAITMIGTCEAFNLAEKLGLDAQTFYDIASTASGQSWSMTSYCPAPGPVPTAPSNRDYAPGFAVALMLKDLGLAMDAAASVRADTPIGSNAAAIYDALAKDGHADMDFSVVMRRIQGAI